MKLTKKLFILSILLGFGIMPSFAKIEAGITQTYFYNTEKTLMSEVSQDKTLKTEKYWTNNPFYFSKYRPLFMLSNKELYDLKPKERPSVVQRFTAPSVYNISFKTASITTISLGSEDSRVRPTHRNQQTPLDIRAQFNPVQNAQMPTKTVAQASLEDRKFMYEYEQAKNPDADSDAKIDAALYLRDSKKVVHHRLALDLLDDVTRVEPYNAYAFYLKGEIYAKDKSPQNAMKNYVAALRLNPTSKQCYLGIAKVLEPTNKSLAQKYYAKAAANEG